MHGEARRPSSRAAAEDCCCPRKRSQNATLGAQARPRSRTTFCRARLQAFRAKYPELFRGLIGQRDDLQGKHENCARRLPRHQGLAEIEFGDEPRAKASRARDREKLTVGPARQCGRSARSDCPITARTTAPRQGIVQDSICPPEQVMIHGRLCSEISVYAGGEPIGACSGWTRTLHRCQRLSDCTRCRARAGAFAGCNCATSRPEIVPWPAKR